MATYRSGTEHIGGRHFSRTKCELLKDQGKSGRKRGRVSIILVYIGLMVVVKVKVFDFSKIFLLYEIVLGERIPAISLSLNYSQYCGRGVEK